MTEPNYVLDPALAARLPARLRRLLEERVPCGKEYDHNLGIMIGLQFARVLLDAAPESLEQAREVVATAVKLLGARLDKQFADRQPDLYAKWKSVDFDHETIAQCATHDPNDPTDVPLDDFIRELEEKHGLPPESGAA